MSTATIGLRTALARGASGSVIAIAEMQADELFASLTDEQKVELGAKLTPGIAAGAVAVTPPVAGASDPQDTPEEDDPEAAKKEQAAAASANAAERARVKAVAKAVAEDEPCKGKAGLALSMLADDDFAELSGAAMVKMIGKAGSASGEDEGGKAMLDAMRAANPDLGNASGASATPKAEENHGWGKIHDEIRDRRQAR